MIGSLNEEIDGFLSSLDWSRRDRFKPDKR